MSGEWFSGLTEDGRPIVIDGHQVKTVSVTRQADGMLSVEFGDSGSVVMATPELVQEWADNVNTLTAQRDAARDIAARLEAQLAAVADLHRPQPIYDECERDCPDHGIPLNYYTGCPDRIIAMACRHCCLDADGDQTEDCATYHDHTEHTCSTAAALAIPDDDADPDAVIAEGES